MKAHQRKIREQIGSESSGDLFGKWWLNIDVDIKKAIVKPVTIATAKSIIEEYEWLGCMPAVVWFCYGIFFDGYCGGVVCYGPEYSENLGIQARESGRKCADWSKYGFEGKMILLSRGACVHWAHPHAASKLIRKSMDMLPPKYEIVTATVDAAAGEIGTIYQACGFDYVGSMREQNKKVAYREKDRDAWLINGKLYGTRTIRALVGSVRKADVLAKFPSAVLVKQHSKGRYFAFRGSRSAQKKNRAAIAHLLKPYPKRGIPTDAEQ